MTKYNKMMGAGFGAALAKLVVSLLPEMDEATKTNAEYVLLTIISAAVTYMVPENERPSS